MDLRDLLALSPPRPASRRLLQSAACLSAAKRQRMLGERTLRIPTVRLNLSVEQ